MNQSEHFVQHLMAHVSHVIRVIWAQGRTRSREGVAKARYECLSVPVSSNTILHAHSESREKMNKEALCWFCALVGGWVGE